MIVIVVGKLVPSSDPSMVTCGSCDGIAIKYEDNPMIDNTFSGLGGVVRKWVSCFNVTTTPPGGNMTAYDTNLQTFNPLFEAFIGFGTDFLDPLVCPFTVFENCLNFIGNDDCTKDFVTGATIPFQNPLGDPTVTNNNGDFCCPIKATTPTFSATVRDLSCAKLSFGCILGEKFSTFGPPTGDLPDPNIDMVSNYFI